MSPQAMGRVVHFTPGRLRLRVDRSKRSPALYDDLRGLLSTLPGVTSVDIAPETGSILVSYDPASLDADQLLQLGAELGWISPFDGHPAQFDIRDWRSYVDVPRARQALVFLGIAGLGALAGPAFGVGARVGSISASVGYIAISRWARSAKQKNTSQ
jgi:hypothetical protein